MAVNIHNLIAAINPDVYCEEEFKNKVKKAVKEGGYLKAAEIAEAKKSYLIDANAMKYKNSFDKLPLKNPTLKQRVVYEASGSSLEPMYYWLIRYIETKYKKVDKLVDNFVSAPGSGHFSEMGQKATRMQEEAMKMFGAINQVIKSILNLIYDLKEFKIRLSVYDDYNSKDKTKKENAFLSLKQVWMDNVDIKRGNSSIKAMAQQFDFITIIDAFMKAENSKQVDMIDLNDRVKRILKQRVSEFETWIVQSEKELRKRYEIEKNYLKSQVNTVKIYSRWIKPYLKSAKMLEQQANGGAAIVNLFNTSYFELILLGYYEMNMAEFVGKGYLPEIFKKYKNKRKYYSSVIVDLKFTSMPERANQQGGYGFRGRIDAEFTSYVFSEDELKVLRQELEKDDFGDMYRAIEGATSDSLEQLQTDIDELLSEKKDEMKKIEESDDVNPFSSLFSFLSREKSSDKKNVKKELPIPLKLDNEVESVIRSEGTLDARGKCATFYGLFKRAYSMPAF